MADPLPADLAQALASLYRAGKVASPWLPGMLTERGDCMTRAQPSGDHIAPPDPSDPATLGCLLALVREAHGDPGMHAACARDRSYWWVYYSGGFGPAGHGSTEAHALLAALRAALPTETP